MVNKVTMMFALFMIVVSLSPDVLAVESHIRVQGMTDTNRDLKKDKKPAKCFTGTQTQILDFCATNNCCDDGGDDNNAWWFSCCAAAADNKWWGSTRIRCPSFQL